MRWVFLFLVAVVGSAHAEPAVSLSITASELDIDLATLAEQLDEPIGLVARAKTPRLGLEKGDIVRTMNGVAPQVRLHHRIDPATIVFLDVLRRGKPVAIRLQIKQENVVVKLRRDRFAEELASAVPADAVAQVTRDGKPSGLWLRSAWYSAVPLEAGDILRSVDGVAVHTTEGWSDALDRARAAPKLDIALDRAGQAFMMTVILEDPFPGIEKIHALSDTTYELPRSFVDAVLLDPRVVTANMRLVPSIKNSRPDGFKLYAIRPGSLAAALGFANGDTVVSIGNLDLSSASEADIRDQLRTATELKVKLERRGKTLTFVYVIEPSHHP